MTTLTTVAVLFNILCQLHAKYILATLYQSILHVLYTDIYTYELSIYFFYFIDHTTDAYTDQSLISPFLLLVILMHLCNLPLPCITLLITWWLKPVSHWIDPLLLIRIYLYSTVPSEEVKLIQRHH